MSDDIRVPRKMTAEMAQAGVAAAVNGPQGQPWAPRFWEAALLAAPPAAQPTDSAKLVKELYAARDYLYGRSSYSYTHSVEQAINWIEQHDTQTAQPESHQLALHHNLMGNDGKANPPQPVTPVEDGCICKGNWRAIIKGCQKLIGEIFSSRGNDYRFFGVVWAEDDFYYGMQRLHGDKRTALLSCVGSIEMYGYTLKQPVEAKEIDVLREQLRKALEQRDQARKVAGEFALVEWDLVTPPMPDSVLEEMALVDAQGDGGAAHA